MEENNLNKIPPILSNLRIIADSCNINGTFRIESYANSEFNKDIYFYLNIDSPQIQPRCKIPTSRANSYIEIECYTSGSISGSKIIIEEKLIYEIENNELFYINHTESENNVNCLNYESIKKEQAVKKMNAVISFRQASKFQKNGNKYQLFLATFINLHFFI